MATHHEQFMARAIELAQEGMDGNSGGPFGAVIVKDNQVIAEGFNQVTSTPDPTAHAEVTAIREAARELNNPWLDDCTLYTSCEPCPMCLGATLWSHIRTMYYAATRDDAADIGFDDAAFYEELGMNLRYKELTVTQLMRAKAAAVMQLWKT